MIVLHDRFRPLYFLLIAGTILATLPGAHAASIIPLSAWQPRRDGGNPPVMRAGPDGLSLIYTDRPPHWGNFQTAMTLPADTTGIELDLTKRSAAPAAQLTLGLEETDGDIWFGEALFNGRPLGQAPDGELTTRIPIGQFRFEPRGNRIRQITSTRRLILILNNGDSSITIHRIALDENAAAGITGPPPETPVTPVRGPNGAAALLTGPFPANPGAANPATLSHALQAAGYGAVQVSGANVCDPAVLNRAHFDLLALPNSPYFPAAGLQTLRNFLKAGGKLLCFGGYAFDHPTVYVSGRWVETATTLSAAALDNPAAAAQFNTRSGIPGDTMSLSPDQIGMFDPSCRFQNATLVSALGRPVSGAGRWSGYTAVSVIGNDSPVFLKVWARTTPLCLFQDARGREAPLASLAQIYDGPYRGSAWAFFGAINRDVTQIPAIRAALPAMIKRLSGNVAIHDLSTQYALYHPGEIPAASVVVDNFRSSPLHATLTLITTAGTTTGSASTGSKSSSPRRARFTDNFSIVVPAHSSHTYTRHIPIAAYPGALYMVWARIQAGGAGRTEDGGRARSWRRGARLALDPDLSPGPFPKREGVTMLGGVSHFPAPQSSHPHPSAFPLRISAQIHVSAVDLPPSSVLRPSSSVTTGFALADSTAQRSKWPVFSYRDNAFRVNGKPEFLVGTNRTGAVFMPGNDENPLTWDHDFGTMAAHGVHLCRVLHFSPFVTWLKTGQNATALDLAGPLPEDLMRRLDALVQIAAHHGVALFLSLHDWIPVALSDRELAAEQSFVERVARRYRGAQNLFFDIQNEPSVDPTDTPDVRRLWNDYLRTKYHTDAALSAAWRISPPKAPLGQVPLTSGTSDWEDIRTWDYNHFKTVLLNRWTAANAAGIHAGDPARPVTVGYLPSLPPADKILGQRHLDFSDMHYYGSPDGLPLEFALTDRRFEGKGLSIGEFGAQEEHNQRVNGQDVTADDAGWFERLGAVALGMGAAFVENWCWKDMNGVVFPWGVIGRDGLGKPTLDALSRVAAMGRKLVPGGFHPTVYLLIPDSNRQGGDSPPILNALHNSAAMLLGSHVPFGVINEESLDRLPHDARALIWPVPFCPSDASFNRVMVFVQHGGSLYVSGDLSYSPLRTRDRLDRLKQLCGVSFVRENYPNIRIGAVKPGPVLSSPCIDIQLAGAVPQDFPGIGTVYLNRVGQGRVFYTPDPVELHSTDSRVYRAFFGWTKTPAIAITPDDPAIQVFRVQLAGGGAGVIVVNTGPRTAAVTLHGHPLQLKAGSAALAAR